jgi:tetratricopeptide (TPR) repeat protein
MAPFCVVRPLFRLVLLGASLCAAGGVAWAESGVLVVHVEDVQRHPISGVQIGTEGDGGSEFTGNDGKARIPLAKQTKEKSWVSLQILQSPPHKDFVMLSPWDYRAVVPLFENESENFVKVVVVQRGDRMALESGTALAALTAQIDKANASKNAGKQAAQVDPKANLAAVAKQYGLGPDDLDHAIRAQGVNAIDPYNAGLAALYAQDYPGASAKLAESLQEREKKRPADLGAVADAALFLGRSLYLEGNYKESATAYLRSLQLRPDDDDEEILQNTGVSLVKAGDDAAAEPFFRRALEIDQRTPGPDSPEMGRDLANLAELLRRRGDYVTAKPMFQHSLEILRKALGPESAEVANSLDDLGLLEEDKRDYAAAEPMFRRALAINEKALGPDSPEVARVLNNLAGLMCNKGDYAAAEPLQRRALAIWERALGFDHPDVVLALYNLAYVLQQKGDYTAAGPLLQRALKSAEKVLTPDDPLTTQIKRDLQALIDQGSLK